MAVEPLADLDDPRLGDYAHLRAPSTRQRLEQQLGIFTVEGWRSLEALLATPSPGRAVLDADEHAARAGALVPDAIPAFSIPAASVEQVTGVDFHRGVLAVAERPAPRPVEEVVAGRRTLLLVEGVNDHENLGALFRSAAAFGVDAVVLDPTSSDPLYRRATRVSLGHVLRVPFARAEHDAWPAVVAGLVADGVIVLALTPDPAAEPLWPLVDALAGARTAVLVGAEGPGLTDEAMTAASRRVRIPMVPGTDSVNVATAAAIALAALHGAT
jgi:tRNA G18 (ribose-2'-O)-methylase SpoU